MVTWSFPSSYEADQTNFYTGDKKRTFWTFLNLLLMSVVEEKPFSPVFCPDYRAHNGLINRLLVVLSELFSCSLMRMCKVPHLTLPQCNCRLGVTGGRIYLQSGRPIFPPFYFPESTVYRMVPLWGETKLRRSRSWLSLRNVKAS